MNSLFKKSNFVLNYSKVLKGNLNNIPKFGFLTKNIINNKLKYHSCEINFNNDIQKKHNFFTLNKKFFTEKNDKDPKKDEEKKDEEKKDEEKIDEEKKDGKKEKTEEEKKKEKERGNFISI
jgi:Ran GTPase-activating protein (RanGAP) involved in mRNA processing and transport